MTPPWNPIGSTYYFRLFLEILKWTKNLSHWLQKRSPRRPGPLPMKTWPKWKKRFEFMRALQTAATPRQGGDPVGLHGNAKADIGGAGGSNHSPAGESFSALRPHIKKRRGERNTRNSSDPPPKQISSVAIRTLKKKWRCIFIVKWSFDLTQYCVQIIHHWCGCPKNTIDRPKSSN